MIVFLFQAIGCILAELQLVKRFVENIYTEQLDNIFHVFGTPSYHTW